MGLLMLKVRRSHVIETAPRSLTAYQFCCAKVYPGRSRSAVLTSAAEASPRRHVEDWSPALDAPILYKTTGAVVRGRGEY